MSKKAIAEFLETLDSIARYLFPKEDINAPEPGINEYRFGVLDHLDSADSSYLENLFHVKLLSDVMPNPLSEDYPGFTETKVLFKKKVFNIPALRKLSEAGIDVSLEFDKIFITKLTKKELSNV